MLVPLLLVLRLSPGVDRRADTNAPAVKLREACAPNPLLALAGELLRGVTGRLPVRPAKPCCWGAGSGILSDTAVGDSSGSGIMLRGEATAPAAAPAGCSTC